MKTHPLDGAHTRARSLRWNITDAEKRLWRILRSRQIEGYKFRRQVPFGRYIADFVCHEARLIIEIDGGQHNCSSPAEVARSGFLQGQGYRLLRFWNNEVIANLEGVHSAIADALHTPSPSMGEGWGGGEPAAPTPGPAETPRHHPHPNPPPSRGRAL